MRVESGALLRDQNDDFAGASGDSCFDTSELYHMASKLGRKDVLDRLKINQFVIDGKLQRHPQTKWWNDISSDQAHCYALATGNTLVGLHSEVPSRASSGWPKTNNGDRVLVGFLALIKNWLWLSNICLIGQIILFPIPFRWSDGENPNFRFGPIKLDLGHRHWCGDYRLFKQSLYYAPWWIRRMVSKKKLKQMSAWYWEPEPNIYWLLEIDSKYIDECL